MEPNYFIVVFVCIRRHKDPFRWGAVTLSRLGVCYTNWLDIVSTIEQRLKLNVSFMVKYFFLLIISINGVVLSSLKMITFFVLFAVIQLKAILIKWYLFRRVGCPCIWEM